MNSRDINFGHSFCQPETRSLVDVLKDGSKEGFGNVSIGGSSRHSSNVRTLSQSVTAHGAETEQPSPVSPRLRASTQSCSDRAPASTRQDWDMARIGRVALANGNLIDAMFNFQKLYEEAKRRGSPEQIAEAATDLAYISSLTGSPERASRLYGMAIDSWSKARSEQAIKSPRVMSAFALFLFDYAEYRTMQNNFIVAAKARRRLSELAKRFSPVTIYSALAKRLHERGQVREAKMVLDLARTKPIRKEQAAYNQKMLSNARAIQEPMVFLPPIDLPGIK